MTASAEHDQKNPTSAPLKAISSILKLTSSTASSNSVKKNVTFAAALEVPFYATVEAEAELISTSSESDQISTSKKYKPIIVKCQIERVRFSHKSVDLW